MATLGFPLRFDNEKQKSDIVCVAKKNKRSLNAELLHMINIKILESKTIGTSSKNKK